MGAKYSGGVVTYNLREGYRSEYIAHVAFSAFGPSNPYPREDDFGLDLVCNLAEVNGKMMNIKSTYGVQVKSEGTGFEFKAKEAVLWLNGLEFPLLLADVSKSTFSIKIYTTWNVNRLLPEIDFDDLKTIPDRLIFLPDVDPELKFPDPLSGIIPIGKPIVEFKLDSLGNKKERDYYWKILKEWIDIDSNNYRFRRAGIMSSYGYLNWSTNKSIDDERRAWDKHYYFSPNHNEGVKKMLSEAFILNGLFCKESYVSTKDNKFMDEFNSSKDYVDKHLGDTMSNFGKDIFKNKI